MRKRLLGILVLCAMLAAFALAGCGSGESSTEAPVGDAAEVVAEAPAAAADLPSFATLGEVFAADPESMAYSYSEEAFACAFELDGVPMRVTADMTTDIYKACDAISYEDEDHDAKIQEVLGSLPVKSVEDLSLSVIPQEELDAFVGKTGQDMLDAGFTEGDYFATGEDSEVALANGYHQYAVTFDEVIPEDTEFSDIMETIAPLTISSVSYAGLSSAASEADTPTE